MTDILQLSFNLVLIFITGLFLHNNRPFNHNYPQQYIDHIATVRCKNMTTAEIEKMTINISLNASNPKLKNAALVTVAAAGAAVSGAAVTDRLTYLETMSAGESSSDS